ncbi:MAG: glycosyltransferase [Bacteroidetes bacterium]|nr:glycosyltransferase [Bacteroidota bacterium]
MEPLRITWSVLDAMAWLALMGYAAYVAFSLFGYLKLQLAVASPAADLPPLTVIIPARNEEARLAACLDAVLAQQHPRFHILVVDDASTDATLRIARQYAERDDRVTVLRGHSGKKAALQQGIAEAATAWVVTLDADCTPPPGWLATLGRAMIPDIAMVCGPVTLVGGGIFGQWQALESAGLMVLSAGAFGLDMPGMNNGANLALRKDAFLAVGGYAGTDHLASGDDMLLLQKLRRAGYCVRYAADKAAVVPTQACSGLSGFLQQRRRWVSKARAYRNPFLLLGSGSLFVFFLAWLLLLPAALLFSPLFPTLGVLLGLKWLLDAPVLAAGVALVRRPLLLLWYPVVQLLQIPYVIWAGCMSLSPGAYRWKDRIVR